MKKIRFDSLEQFYEDCTNKVRSSDFDRYNDWISPSWMGLGHSDIMKHKFSYPFGVEKIREYQSLRVEAPRKIKYYNQFDGYDINIDRMMDNLDFLIDDIKRKRAPKCVDIYVNLSESSGITYDQMVNKTWAAISIIDNLENQGIRCAVYAVACKRPMIKGRKVEDCARDRSQDYMLEICLKRHNDTLNLGAICTGISPWLFRYWTILWSLGNVKGTDLDNGCSWPMQIPRNMVDTNSIVIDKGECFTQNDADQFVKEIQETNKINQEV